MQNLQDRDPVGRRKTLVFLALLLATSAAAQTHPMTFEDMLSLHRIGAPQPSPDGKWIAYDASTPNLAANKSAR